MAVAGIVTHDDDLGAQRYGLAKEGNGPLGARIEQRGDEGGVVGQAQHEARHAHGEIGGLKGADVCAKEVAVVGIAAADCFRCGSIEAFSHTFQGR